MRKYILNIILLFILLTPVFNISELLQFLQGENVSVLNYSGLSFLKYLKDIFFFIILILCLINVFIKKKINIYNEFYLLFIIFCLGSMIASVAFVPILGVLAGLRMIFPLILLPLLYECVDQQFARRVANVLFYIFLIHFVLQLFQAAFLGNLMFGTNALGLSKRNPGIYIIPSSAGFFALICNYFFDYHLASRKFIKKPVLNLIVFISIFLCGSGTSVVTYLIYQLLKFLFKFDAPSKRMLVLPMIGVVVLFFVALPVLTSRADIFISLATRIGIAGDVLSPKNILLSLNFGLGTNIAKILKVPGSLVLDSTYTAIIYNIGVIGLIVYMFFIYRLFYDNYINGSVERKKQFLSFCSIYLTFSFTVIIFEAFPMNLLFAIGLSYFKWVKEPAITTITV